MKSLILVRHAKSSWKHPELKDIERPLKKRGLRDAPVIGKVLKELHVKPDVIISSPAERALATAKILAGELGLGKSDIKEEPNLYLNSGSKLLHEINALDDQFN